MTFKDYWKKAGTGLSQDVPDGAPCEALMAACESTWDDAQNLTIGRVVTMIWGRVKAASDPAEKKRLKAIAALVAEMES